MLSHRDFLLPNSYLYKIADDPNCQSLASHSVWIDSALGLELHLTVTGRTSHLRPYVFVATASGAL